MNWDQLVQGVELPFHPDLKVPALTEVRLAVPDPAPVGDVAAAAHADVVARFAGEVTPGMTVAVGGGSRGLTDRVALLRGTIEGLRALGAEPFVVPAMGSHGGAKAEGQLAMLASLGVTEESVGAEIRATMETVEVARRIVEKSKKAKQNELTAAIHSAELKGDVDATAKLLDQYQQLLQKD